MKKLLHIIAIVSCMLASAIATHAQTDIYVDQSATGANNGATWANAYTRLSDAMAQINANPGVAKFEVRVATGTYYPAGTEANNTTYRDSAFTIIRGGIYFYGGYPAGGDISRNPAANPVYLDGTNQSYHVW